MQLQFYPEEDCQFRSSVWLHGCQQRFKNTVIKCHKMTVWAPAHNSYLVPLQDQLTRMVKSSVDQPKVLMDTFIISGHNSGLFLNNQETTIIY